VKFTKIIFYSVLSILILSGSACQQNNDRTKAEAENLVQAGQEAYPDGISEGIVLTPINEEPIYPDLEGDRLGEGIPEAESYPSISAEEPLPYPGVSEQDLYPYPLSDMEDNFVYPDPQNNTSDDATNPSENVQASPTPTNTLAPLITAEPTPTATQEVFVTPTLTLTPTPSPTVVPTATPLPVFIDRSLKASDPKQLKLASGKVQLVEFFAFWDATSKAMAPLINQLKSDYGTAINIVFLDIDDPATKNWKTQLGFQQQPHLFLLDAKGYILQDWTGFVEEVEIREEITKALQR
jgi:thiol-disulfide isomerase/thioredoxin